MEYRSRISIAALVSIVLLVFVPEQAWASMPSVCLFRNLFHVECLGCGMTRALAAAAHGNFSVAIAFNAGVVVTAPALLFAAVQGLRVFR